MSSSHYIVEVGSGLEAPVPEKSTARRSRSKLVRSRIDAGFLEKGHLVFRIFLKAFRSEFHWVAG
jgi:hypothetical protein